MNGEVGSPAAARMQENFGCTVANRFCQLLDDESDPSDILRRVERRQQQQRKKRDEAAAAGGRAMPGRRTQRRRESQRERKRPVAAAAAEPPQAGQKQPPLQEEQQGFSNGGAEVKQDEAGRTPSSIESHPDRTERQVEFQGETPDDHSENSDWQVAVRGRAGGRGGMRGKRRAGRINRSFDNSDQRGKREFERRHRSDDTGMEQAAPMEEAEATAKHPRRSEREPWRKAAEAKPVEEVVREMTLDEWKKLQQQKRPKPEFNIRKPESTVPSKAVVIHKSKYSHDLQKGFKDGSCVFRKPMNDITAQLDINFGNLPCPVCGSSGVRGVCGRRVEEIRPQSKVVVQPVAPNTYDPEDFPALH